MRAQQLFEAAHSADTDLLKQMKMIRGSKTNHASCPDSIDKAEGPEQISELFKAVYEEMYNSAPTIDAMHEI